MEERLGSNLTGDDSRPQTAVISSGYRTSWTGRTWFHGSGERYLRHTYQGQRPTNYRGGLVHGAGDQGRRLRATGGAWFYGAGERYLGAHGQGRRPLNYRRSLVHGAGGRYLRAHVKINDCELRGEPGSTEGRYGRGTLPACTRQGRRPTNYRRSLVPWRMKTLLACTCQGRRPAKCRRSLVPWRRSTLPACTRQGQRPTNYRRTMLLRRRADHQLSRTATHNTAAVHRRERDAAPGTFRRRAHRTASFARSVLLVHSLSAAVGLHR